MVRLATRTEALPFVGRDELSPVQNDERHFRDDGHHDEDQQEVDDGMLVRDGHTGNTTGDFVPAHPLNEHRS